MQFLSVVLATAAVLSGAAQAQNSTYPYTIGPGTVPAAMRISWCTDQRASCNSICGGNAPDNNCNADQLTYSCTCGDMSRPNITQYNNTLPFHECQTYRDQCVAANPINATAQQACIAIPCGGRDPARAAVSSSSSSSSSMSSATSSPSGSATSSSARPSNTSSAATALISKMDATVGTVALVVSAGMLFGGLLL